MQFITKNNILDFSLDLNADAKCDEEIEVDVTKAEPVAAFCSSDEEGEDENALQFLPMAPEVEDPEDGWAVQDGLEGGGSSSKDTESSTLHDYGDVVTAKKRKLTNYDISLPDAPVEEVHPLVSSKTNKDKQSAGKKAAGRPKK